MKRYIQIALWILAAVLVVAILSFVTKKQNNALCTGINVLFSDTAIYQYIDKSHVIDLLEAEDGAIVGKPIKKLNTAKIEKKLNDDPYIKHAEVYTKINGELSIDLVQRNPVIRVINSQNNSFYIGQEGVLMPVSNKVHVRMIIANGKVNYNPGFDTITNIYDRKFDTNGDIGILRDLHVLVDHINKNKFWIAQTQQIFITKKGEFELVPLVGNHIIQFGSIRGYKEKFRNLEATYKKGFPVKGWNKFNMVNLKYKNQVICSKEE